MPMSARNTVKFKLESQKHQTADRGTAQALDCRRSDADREIDYSTFRGRHNLRNGRGPRADS